MRYLVTFLVFVGAAFLMIVLSVMMKQNLGWAFGQYINIAVAFGVAALVYKKMEPKRNAEALDAYLPGNHVGLSKLEQKDFTKVFTPKVLKELEIEKVIVTVPMAEDQDFVVHLKHDDYQNIDLEKVKKVLSKRFYHVEKMELIEYDSEKISAADFSLKGAEV
jgi:hypothetical protein